MGVADRLFADVANRARLGADLTRAVDSVERTGTMEGAPALALTVDDPRDVFMGSSLLTRPAERTIGTPAAATLRPIDLLLDGVWYRLQQARREGDGVGLTFDHRGMVYMGEHDTPLAASRNARTRALFIRRQVDEVGRRRGAGHRLGFWSWEVRRRMPIARAETETSTRSEVDRDVADTTDAAKSFKSLKLRGHEVDAGQRRNMALVLGVADELKVGPKATLALVMACLVEAPDFKNPTGGEGSSVGILQLTDDHLGGDVEARRDVVRVARLFLQKGFTTRSVQAGGAIGAARKHPELDAGELAQFVQGSDYGSRYNERRRDAENVIDAAGSIATRPGAGGSYVKPFMYRRERGEDAWTSTGKLAGDVGRRRFITIPAPGSDLFMYAADVDLLRLRSQAVIVPDATYVVGEPEYDLDWGKTARAMRVTVMGDAFDADFAWGLPVTVNEAGPASGKWLVWDVREVDGDPAVELELRQPQPAKLEPAAERVERNDTSDSDSDADGTATGRVVARAKAISERDYPYVWGGGHGTAGKPSGGIKGGTGGGIGLTGFDCSGYVCACLDAGGMLPGHNVLASGGLMSWGEAGKGDRLTVWANGGHVFIQVKIKGEKVKWIDTSRAAGGKSGPHVRYGDRDTSGFTPRHWPGT